MVTLGKGARGTGWPMDNGRGRIVIDVTLLVSAVTVLIAVIFTGVSKRAAGIKLVLMLIGRQCSPPLSGWRGNGSIRSPEGAVRCVRSTASVNQ